MALVVKNLAVSAGDVRDVGSILGQEDALEEGMANCSSIPKNAMDRGAWRATVYGVTESWT